MIGDDLDLDALYEAGFGPGHALNRLVEALRAARARIAELEAQPAPRPRPQPPAPYGYCPHCGAPGLTRERCPNGNDTCEIGHTYPSKAALAKIRRARPVPG